MTYGFTPAKISITADSSKVPKERDQMRIDFFAKSNFGSLENVSFSLSGNDITLIEISPSSSIILDENGISGYAILKLSEIDSLYKVYLVCRIENRIENGISLYFRNEQGNALRLTEDQYLRFVKEKKQMWLNSEAEDKAKADLEALRARGLQIAVEKWPKEDTFIPLENNIGETIQIQDNSLYEVKLTEKAIQDPSFKDLVKIQLEPISGPDCYYANFTTNEEIQFLPLCANLLATLKIIVRIYDPNDNNSQEHWIETPIEATIKYPGLAYDECTDTCKVKMFSKNLTIEMEPLPPGQTGSTVGVGYAGLVNVPPSPYFVLESIKFITKNERVSAGSCSRERYSLDCWETHPKWINGSENVIYWHNGSYGSGAMIETIRCDASSTIPECQGFKDSPNDPLRLNHYVAIVNATNYPNLDDDIKVEKIPIFDNLNKINNFWSDTFSNYYIDYKACPGDFGYPGIFSSCDQEPVIALQEFYCFSTGTIAHETGHWLQYRMQRNWLEGGGKWETCVVSAPETAFSEGFAEWHKLYLFSDTFNEEDTPCAHDYSNPYYYQLPASPKNFLWDVFDNVDDEDRDHICSDYNWDNCGDLVYLIRQQLTNWIGKRYNTIWEFINGLKAPGMPLYGDTLEEKCKVCKLQNSHGLLSEDCYQLNCN